MPILEILDLCRGLFTGYTVTPEAIGTIVELICHLEAIIFNPLLLIFSNIRMNKGYTGSEMLGGNPVENSLKSFCVFQKC